MKLFATLLNCKKNQIALWLIAFGFFTFFLPGCKSMSSLKTKKEQNLRINLRKEPTSLDPRKGSDMSDSQFHFMLFEGLLRLNPDMTLSLAQAASYTISPDGKIYTFHLKDSKWSDGKEVTAHDFEKSWKSILDPTFACRDAYLLYTVKHARAAKKGEIPLNDVGIHANDAKTLIVELEAPSPHFLQIVASPVLLPFPSHCASTSQFASNGPFKLKEWKFNREIIFEKNPTYLRANEVKLNHIFVEMIDREMSVLHMYTSGHFDLVGTPLSLFPAMLRQDLEKKKLLTIFPVAGTKFLSFNTARFPFHNVNIRRAFAYAINRTAIVEHITQLQEKAALNLIPPALLSQEAIPLFKDADHLKAQECLRKGLEELALEPRNLKDLPFIYVSNETNHTIAQQLQNDWLEVLGIQVSLEQTEFNLLHERSKKGEFAIGIFAWIAEYGDPMNILERFEDKTTHRNYSKWQHTGFNQLLTDAKNASSRDEYLRNLSAAESLLIDEMPLTGLYHDNFTFLIQPHVQGFAISPLGHIYFDKISLHR
jgi:oligopeptide transport system substrate-binding protein